MSRPETDSYFEVVRLLKAKKAALLEEVDRIDRMILEIDTLLVKGGHQPEPDIQTTPKRERVNQIEAIVRRSRDHSRSRLVEFLMRTGQATRQDILAQTGIPPGTLSALLGEDQFESREHGVWRLKQKGD